LTVSLLPEPESERELARLGIRWRGYTEAIARVDDLLPAGFPVCLRVLAGLQGEGDPDTVADEFLRRDRQALTRGFLREMELERIEPLIGDLGRPRLERLLDVLPGAPGGELFGHYWAGGDATAVAVPLDRVIRGGRAALVAVAAGPVWWRPPSTIWDVDGSWVMVSYTDSPSTYVGLTRAYPGLIEQLGLPAVCWAERSDRVDDWMAPLPGER
jgi:hypothetical protein